jgi:spore germination protein YaaH
VVLVCFGIDVMGDAQPSDAASREAFATQAAWAKGLGYRVKVGVSLHGADPVPTGTSTAPASPFTSVDLRAKVVSSLIDIAGYGDGLELDLRYLPDAATSDVTMIISDVSAVVRPGGTLGVFVPATMPDASGLPPSGVSDLEALSVAVDRVRVMTLDYSLGGQPGPTIDSGWATDSANAALGAVGRTPIDVAMPLYGWQWDAEGEQTVTYAQAQSIVSKQGSVVERAPSGAPFFSYPEGAVWFDDAQSTVLTLAAWPTAVLPPGVGVVFYDLGAEDPGVWSAIEEATP